MLDWPEGPMIKDNDIRFDLSLVRFERLWRVIETESGYLGMVPHGTKAGDDVCIFSSCDTPVVLRKSLENCHTFVGNAYVVGLMDGEAAAFTESKRIVPQLLELR